MTKLSKSFSLLLLCILGTAACQHPGGGGGTDLGASYADVLEMTPTKPDDKPGQSDSPLVAAETALRSSSEAESSSSEAESSSSEAESSSSEAESSSSDTESFSSDAESFSSEIESQDVEVFEPTLPASRSPAWETEVQSYTAQTLNRRLGQNSSAVAKVEVTLSAPVPGILNTTASSFSTRITTTLVDGKRVVTEHASQQNLVGRLLSSTQQLTAFFSVLTLGIGLGSGLTVFVLTLPLFAVTGITSGLGPAVLLASLGITLVALSTGVAVEYFSRPQRQAVWSNHYLEALHLHGLEIEKTLLGASDPL